MKCHRKIVITSVTSDVSSHVRSAGTCRTHSHIGGLARNQQCPMVKTFDILKCENETFWNFFIKKRVFRRPTSVELMAQRTGLLQGVRECGSLFPFRSPSSHLNHQAVGSASFSVFELEFPSWTQETSLIIFSLKIMFTTSCFMFSDRTLQRKIVESQNPGIIKIRKNLLKSSGSNSHPCSKQSQWGSGCFFNQLVCVCMYVFLCTHFISTYIPLHIFSITVFLKLEILRIILGSLIDKQKLLIRSCPAQQWTYSCTATVPDSCCAWFFNCKTTFFSDSGL